jgi:DNA invertase Pin-like site-specific DNA recombinase
MELLESAFETLDAADRDTSGWREFFAEYGVQISQKKPVSYKRRSNNQKSAVTESLIKDLLQRGWSKSAVAKELGVNRRVVIRVARENPECTEKSKINRLKTAKADSQAANSSAEGKLASTN